ncbi:phosphotransferase [Saccharothrix sp. Mg75]|uniref:phosphotransferase n=1 Tax=Saccharothrix sp. Mg75 TaxID=3445357 RepID=UPI003EE946AC
MDEELLTGGGLNEVVRVGATVRRPTGPWTPNVHRLLERLAPLGIAPRAHGVDERGREVLTHLAGEVAHPPLPGWARSEEVLVAVARLARRLHDASAGLAHVRDGWQFPALSPVEVICHNDLAPYNTVFRDGLPVAFIDFDGARPGPRWWDLAYTAYCLVPFSPEWGTPDEQWRRAELFCAAYGTGVTGLGARVLARLDDMVTMIRERPEFHRQRAERHDEYYLGHAVYVKEHFQDR